MPRKKKTAMPATENLTNLHKTPCAWTVTNLWRKILKGIVVTTAKHPVLLIPTAKAAIRTTRGGTLILSL
jgi:hypothetical protein